MKIIAGLGNPGSKYETTRHNVGFLAVDRLVERWRASGPSQKSHGEVYQSTVDGEKILLVKPQTYMNLSGKCIAPLYQFYQCRPEDLIVIHDDLDLSPLSLRLKTGGSAGGHNGLKSIDECLGKTQSGYHRVRIGVGHPARTPGLPGHITRLSAADYVLMPFTDLELADLDPLLDDVGLAVEEILRGRILQAMNRFHQKNSI